MPSPTIATVLPSRLQLPHLLRLLAPAAPRPGPARSIPTSRAIASAVARLSPVSIQTSRPSALQLRDRLARLGLERVGDRDQPSRAGRRRRRTSASRRSRQLLGAAHPDRRERCPARSISARLPMHDLAALDPACDALAGDRASKALGRRQLKPKLVGASHDCLAQRVLGADLGCRRQPQQLALRSARSPATTAVTAGLPRVRVPVLSSTIVLILRAFSSASPPRIRMPFSAALPVPTMIAVGVASPRAQGQAMIRTAIAACRAKVSTRLGPEDQPADEGQRREHQDDRHEVARDACRPAAAWAPSSPGLLDQADDLGQRRVAPDLGGTEDEAAGLVERGADDGVAGAFSTGRLSPVSMVSSSAEWPSRHARRRPAPSRPGAPARGRRRRPARPGCPARRRRGSRARSWPAGPSGP